MPPAVAAVAPAIIGAAGSASGGKKGAGAANRAAERQFQQQQEVFQFGKDLANTGLSAWKPAAGYFQSLLSGDPTQIAQAVGPTSDILKQQSQANARQLAATMPAGGEAAAAGAANAQNSYNNIARLYAGVQPQAAQALGQLSSVPFGAGASFAGMGAPNVGSGLKYDTHQQEQLGQSKGALGTSLGTLAGRGRSSKGSKGASPLPPGDPSICWIAQALYGEDDPRVQAIRAYLLGPFSRYAMGRYVVALYRRYGERVASMPWLVHLLRPLFELALRKAS